MVKVVNQLLDNREVVFEDLHFLLKKVFDVSGLEKQREDLEAELEITAQLSEKEISSGPISDAGKYEALLARHKDAFEKLNTVKEEIVSVRNKRLGIQSFIRNLKSEEQQITEFSPQLFIGLVDHLTFYNREKVTVTFRNGQEITVEAE